MEWQPISRLREPRPGTYFLAGILGALVSWIVLILFQDFRLTPVYTSAVIGAMLCGFLWSAHSFSFRDFPGCTKRMVQGLAVGALAGALGGYAGNYLFNQINRLAVHSEIDLPQTGGLVGLPLGWGILGLLIGLSSAWVYPDSRRPSRHAIGGLFGGLVGGALFEMLRLDSTPVALLAALTAIGAGIGFCWETGRDHPAMNHLKLIDKVRTTFLVVAAPFFLLSILSGWSQSLWATGGVYPRPLIHQADLSNYPIVGLEVSLRNTGGADIQLPTATDRWILLENGRVRPPTQIEASASKGRVWVRYRSEPGQAFTPKVHVAVKHEGMPRVSPYFFARPDASIFGFGHPTREGRGPFWVYLVFPPILGLILLQTFMAVRRKALLHSIP